MQQGKRLHGGVPKAHPVSASEVVLTSLVSIALLALAWWLNLRAGGATGPLMNFFYLPVLIVAVRLRVVEAVVAAAVAGIVAGPLTPLDVGTGDPQTPESWLLRFAFFLLTAAVVAVLARMSMTEIAEMLELRKAAREVRAALAHRQFRLHYQPLFELRTGRLAGAEALIRWDHPKRGLVPPAEFIPAAEANGMIIPLGRWVAQEVVRQAARWHRRIPGEQGFAVAFNLSAAQLHDLELPGIIADALTASALPAAAIHVEITETAVVDNFTEAVARVDELRGLGIRVAIDDFGTGQSSLAYLQQFHADVLKVDRAFVQDIGHVRGQALVAGIVRLANDLGALTVAEGIETEDQADLMRIMGCDLGQGYYYARPAPAKAIDRILALAQVPTQITPDSTGVLPPPAQSAVRSPGETEGLL